VQTSLDSFSSFEIIAFEGDGLRYQLVLIVIGPFYLDGETRDERGHRHLLSAGFEHSLNLTHFGVISQQDGKVRRVGSLQNHGVAASRFDETLDLYGLGGD
jgi:hypothetical protein